MAVYIFKRILNTIPVLLGISIITFLLMNWVPGNPVMMMFEKQTDPATIERISKEMGLNDPLYVQYGRFLWNAVRGDLGVSFHTKEPVSQAIAERFPATVQLALLAMAVGLLIGLSMGILSAVKQNTFWDHGAMVVALLGISMPVFWVGILLQIYFGLKWKLLPISGWYGFQYMILPAIALGTRYAAMIARMTRSSMLEVIRQDFIRTARAKGARERSVVFRHALKNAMIPVVTIIGMQVGGLLTGAILTETVFGIPGLGRLAYEAISFRDYTMIQGTVLFAAVIYVLSNLVVDLSYAFLDPRIRYEGGGSR
ncbi:MAG: ABC transporter permease [Firmicutes bacterium]|nr:ABC transporter permease [Bacillota bacterium]